ncbi:MAG: hypothetical protein ACYDA2_07800 [Acidimicrobiales bacterium]
MSRRLVSSWRREEAGMMALALVATISSVLMLTTVIVFNTNTFTVGDGTFRVQDSEALYAAEGGLDFAYAAVGEATTPAQLPCGSGAITKNFTGTTPVATTASVGVWYYDTLPVTDGPVSCASVQNGSVSPAAAEIVAQGSVHGVNRYMDALVGLATSTVGSVFDKALFSQATMTGSNNPTVYGHNGNDGNLYTNSNVVCGNNFVVQGSVIAQGSFTGNNNCTVDGNVIAVGNVSLSNNTTIGGNLESTGSSGCAGAGTVTMQNNATVDQNAYAYCTITLQNNATVVQNKVQHDTTLTNPTVETFPAVPSPTGTNDGGAKTAWQGAGYTVVTNNTCSGAGSIYNAIPAYTSPTAVVTTCALSWNNNSSITLQTNVAVFSSGGFTMSNNTSWQSNNSTTRLLYLIVPSSVSGVTTTCSNGNPGISLNNNTSFASTINVLYYTPCTMSVANNAAGYGQIYAGTVSVQNNFTEHFVPLPSVPDASGGGQVNGPLSVAVAYERQVQSPPNLG